MKYNNSIFKELISSETTASTKRAVTLLMVFHFVLTSFVILFLNFYVITHIPKGKIDLTLMSSLLTILEYEFYIILSGLGFVTITDFGQMMKEKAKIIAGANILTGNPTADNMTVTKNETKADNITTKNIESVSTNTVNNTQQVPEDLKSSNQNEQE